MKNISYFLGYQFPLPENKSDFTYFIQGKGRHEYEA
jgi:hypothetical protein